MLDQEFLSLSLSSEDLSNLFFPVGETLSTSLQLRLIGANFN